jgi:NitT/TauT family transport system permease protein
MSWGNRICVVIFILCFLVAWQVTGQYFPFFRLLLSSPFRLIVFVHSNFYGLALDFFHTVSIAAISLILSVFVGGFIGVVGASVPKVGRFLEGFSTVIQSVPLIVFAPFTVMLFGVGFASMISLAFIMAVFPMTIGVISASRQAESEFSEVLDFYDVSVVNRVIEVYVPFIMPTLIGHLRVSAGLSILGAVIAEFVGSNSGLGRDVFLGTVRLDPELMVSALLLTSMLGVGVNFLLRLAEARAQWWQQ